MNPESIRIEPGPVFYQVNELRVKLPRYFIFDDIEMIAVTDGLCEIRYCFRVKWWGWPILYVREFWRQFIARVSRI